MSDLQAFRVFCKDAKGKTRVIELKSKSVTNLLVYMKESRRELVGDIQSALGIKIRARSAILVEIIGGKHVSSK